MQINKSRFWSETINNYHMKYKNGNKRKKDIFLNSAPVEDKEKLY